MIKNIVVAVVGAVVVGCIGWVAITSLRREARPSSALVTPTPSVKEQTRYSMSEVAKHGSASDCWLVIQGKVYDVTTFIPDHPGGEQILQGCGKDATAFFLGEREHAEGNVAATYLPTYLIGSIR